MTREEALVEIVAKRDNIWGASPSHLSLRGAQAMLDRLTDSAVRNGVNHHAVSEIAALCLVLLETRR